MQKTTGLTFKEAKRAMEVDFEKVKLPEWTGYWYLSEDGFIMAHTKTGDRVLASVSDFEHRNDWEITGAAFGYDFAVLAMKAGKVVFRMSWPTEKWIFKVVGNTVSKDFIPKFASFPTSVKEILQHIDRDVIFKDSFTMYACGIMHPGWTPTVEDQLATDWMAQ